MANRTKTVCWLDQRNKTNMFGRCGVRKWKSMATQIFGLFINLLFVFPLCPFGWLFFSRYVPFGHANICNLWIWYMKIPIEQKMSAFSSVKHSRWPKCAHFICSSQKWCFYLCLLFITFQPFHNICNIFHLKWDAPVAVSIYLFCAFNRFLSMLTDNNDNVYSNILSKHKYWKYGNCCNMNVTIETTWTFRAYEESHATTEMNLSSCLSLRCTHKAAIHFDLLFECRKALWHFPAVRLPFPFEFKANISVIFFLVYQ